MPEQQINRAAVILAGCGAKDGSEITEAICTIVALQEKDWQLSYFAPNRDTYHVINHLSDEAVNNSSRNMLEEAARITRGKITALTELNVSQYDAIVFPGGVGVAKNFCDLAITKSKPILQTDIASLIHSAYQQKKIIATMCISPILLALAARDFHYEGVHITLGSHPADLQNLLDECGVTHVSCAVQEACLDKKNRFVSSPAYMHPDSTHAQIMLSAKALVEKMSLL